MKNHLAQRHLYRGCRKLRSHVRQPRQVAVSTRGNTHTYHKDYTQKFILFICVIMWYENSSQEHLNCFSQWRRKFIARNGSLQIHRRFTRLSHSEWFWRPVETCTWNSEMWRQCLVELPASELRRFVTASGLLHCTSYYKLNIWNFTSIDVHLRGSIL
jgi:hypothetical protein